MEVTLTMYMKIPTVNEWERKARQHWGYQKRWKDRGLAHIWVAVKQAGLEKIETPCVMQPHIYKKHGNIADPNNYTTPINKIFIDSLTAPKPPKKRGLALLPDDTAEYITHADPIIHYGAAKDRVVLVFTPRGK